MCDLDPFSKILSHITLQNTSLFKPINNKVIVFKATSVMEIQITVINFHLSLCGNVLKLVGCLFIQYLLIMINFFQNNSLNFDCHMTSGTINQDLFQQSK